MNDIFPAVRDNLFGIVNSVFSSMKNDLFFPRRRKNPEELLRDKVRDQFFIIRTLQYQISEQSGEIQELRRQLQEKNDLLAEKDKEIKRQEERIRSLELQQR